MSKYQKLANFLSNKKENAITLSFNEIETIIENSLPDSAKKYSVWWSNGGHSHSETWMNVGFKTTALNLKEQRVTFLKDGVVKTTQTKSVVRQETKTESKPICQPKVFIAENNCLNLDGVLFHQTSFVVNKTDIKNLFLGYNNNTLSQMLEKKQYAPLKSEILKKYLEFLEKNIQEFMEYLLKTNNNFYLKFLNKNGNNDFCEFELTQQEILNKKGLYLYKYKDEIKYIGRCRDNFGNRFNTGYGRINFVNCYKHGQSTNTHLNSLMNKYYKDVTIYLAIMEDDLSIEKTEKELIQAYKPEWNRQL